MYAGVKATDNVYELSTKSCTALSLRLMATLATLILHSAVRPFAVVAVMVVLPAEMAVTFPSALTVATLSSELSQYTFASVGSPGVNVAIKESSSPTAILCSLLLRVMPVTVTTTVTVQVAVLPFSVVAVIVATPLPIAVITPFCTMATRLSEEVHVNCLLLVSVGRTVAVIVAVSLLSSKSSVLSKTTSDATCVTVTVQVAFFPFSAVAVIVAVPLPTAVMIPFEITATEELVLDQVKVRSVAFPGYATAPIVALWPTISEIAVFSISTLLTGTSSSSPLLPLPPETVPWTSTEKL